MIIRELLSVSRKLHKTFNENLKNFGLGSGQVFILITIIENPGLNQDKICKVLELDKSTVTKGMKVLIKNRYIIRVRDKNDLRNWILFPSKHGESIYEKVKIKISDIENDFIKNINNDELEVLSRILKSINSDSL